MLLLMANPEGVEPSTARLEVGCSVQLSYGSTGVITWLAGVQPATSPYREHSKH